MLESIQTELKALIQANELFASAPVITELEGDIATAVDEAIARLGFGCAITVPRARKQDAMRGVMAMAVNFSITVFSNPTLNATGTTAIQGVDALLSLHGQSFAGLHGTPFEFQDLIDANIPGISAFQLTFSSILKYPQ